MSLFHSSSEDPRSIAFRLRIDEVCSEFETAFGRETSSRIEPFVPPGESTARTHVLAELIRTERECRQMIGDDPASDEYLARFPHDTAAVRAAFGDSGLRPGDRVGKYTVAEQLGAGGMGVVYLATDELVGRPVALKVLSAQLTASATGRAGLLAEARSVGRLSHPNVVTLYEAGDERGVCYLVMEYLAGGSAADHLKAHGRFDWRPAVAVIADVCRGLSAAHAAGLVHLDVKPANILLARPVGERTGGLAAKVSDFGLARHTSGEAERERVAGTPRYMAPEQMAGLPTDARTDVYGVGASLFALLTGAPPPLADAGRGPRPDPRDSAPGIPPAVARVVRRCLHSIPQKRFQSVGELLGALEDALRAPGLRPVRWLLVGTALAALIGVGVGVRQLGERSGAVVPAEPREVTVAPSASGASGAPLGPGAEPEVGPWESLFDGKTLAGWDVRRGPIDNALEPRRRGKNDTVFTVTELDNAPVIRGTPEGDWRLMTTRSFENYHLRLEYRRGHALLGERPNSGVMYHYRSEQIDENFLKVRFQELDLWPPEVGHLHSLPDVSMTREFSDVRNYERPAPAWNRVDLLCAGDAAAHAINGHLTLRYRDARIVFGNDRTPYTSGRIQLQAFHGTVYFRNIQIRTIRAIAEPLYQ